MRAPRHTHARAPSTCATCTHLAGGCTARRGLSVTPPSRRPPKQPPGASGPQPGAPLAPPRRPRTAAPANRYRAPSHAGGAGLGLSASPPQLGGSRGAAWGPREGGASRAPRHTHHYGIAVGHRSRHLLAECGGCTAGGRWRGPWDAARGRGSRGGPAPGGGAGPRMARARTPTRARARAYAGAPAPTWQAGPGGGGGRGEAAPVPRSEVAAAARTATGQPSCFLPRGAAVAARR